MDALSFKLPVFEGPLDLLLHLIEKNKLDIYDIPILEITRQYLEYLKSWDEMNLEIASEFIVMAATLINIKAKRLLPEAEKKDEEEENEEAELIRRLLIYKQYKEASVSLKGMFQPDREKPPDNSGRETDSFTGRTSVRNQLGRSLRIDGTAGTPWQRDHRPDSFRIQFGQAGHLYCSGKNRTSAEESGIV